MPDARTPQPSSPSPPSDEIAHDANEDLNPFPLGLGRGDQIFVGVMLLVFAMTTFGYWAKTSRWGQSPIEVERLPEREYDFRLEMNRATWVEWAQLEGIGEVLARKIVADREQRGPFQSVDDLRRVNGIGAKKLATLRRWLYLDEQTPPSVTDH